MGKLGPVAECKVKIKWCSDFAYAIGLIVTDGCLSSDYRHIIYTSKDKELLDKFNKGLGTRFKSGISRNSLGMECGRIQFGDVNFFNYLLSIGLTPAKSKTIGKIGVPKKFFFDFLRGCFDGDGCSYSYMDKRWKSSFIFYLGFASASIDFIHWIREEVYQASGLRGHISSSKNRKSMFYQLRYSKYEAIKLSELLYREKRCLKLTRKYLKIQRAIGIIRKLNRKVLTK